MEKIVDIAKYLSKKYFSEKGELIDEMKLHKITFFSRKNLFLDMENQCLKRILKAGN